MLSQKSDFQNASEAQKSQPKLSAAAPNVPMNMTWARLIMLSLSEKRPKRIEFPDTGLIRGAKPG